jgi:hypothetical protein
LHPVASAVADVPELLDVDMQQLTWSAAFVPADQLAGGPVQPGQAVHSVPVQHCMDRAGGHAEQRPDPGRRELAFSP